MCDSLFLIEPLDELLAADNGPTPAFEFIEATQNPTRIGVRRAVGLAQLSPIELVAVNNFIHPRTTTLREAEPRIVGKEGGEEGDLTSRHNEAVRSVDRKCNVNFHFGWSRIWCVCVQFSER